MGRVLRLLRAKHFTRVHVVGGQSRFLQMTLLTVSNLKGAQPKRKELTFRRLSILD